MTATRNAKGQFVKGMTPIHKVLDKPKTKNEFDDNRHRILKGENK